ncbi:GNAT family N-acetyltransferase [Alkalicoccus luteus]|uniref:GNAT family N-acetyltransferase n=1 Tax=Alkalicoccus luteus TaxID=1237094 RepID=A0A969PQQ4_9BACI|nr:GNAT family N-acetyltransferase [Alkalicoccus luteus]NJP36213.1 GNAT family N-acetyltransferase [Alkalicoccus luteus]
MEQLPEKNLFMCCHEPNKKAFAAFPAGVHVRSMTAHDLPTWMAMPFDDPADASAYRPFMEEYVKRVYSSDMKCFFRQTLIVEDDKRIIGVCTRWKAYGKLETVHWLKTVPEWEGHGIGRALMTQLLAGERFGTRINHVEESMSYLQANMKPELYAKLQIVKAPAAFVQIMDEAETEEC